MEIAHIMGGTAGRREDGWHLLSSWLTEEPVAAWFHGTGWPALADFDYAGRRQALIANAPVLAADRLVGSGDSWYEVPMTPDAVMAITGAMTMVSVMLAPLVGGRRCMIGSYDSLAARSCMLARHESGGQQYRAYANPGTGSAIYAVLGNTAFTGTGFELVAGVWTAGGVSVHRRTAAGAADSAVVPLTVAPGGSDRLRIGRAVAADTFVDPVEIAATLIYSRALSAADLTALAAELRGFFAANMPSMVI